MRIKKRRAKIQKIQRESEEDLFPNLKMLDNEKIDLVELVKFSFIWKYVIYCS